MTLGESMHLYMCTMDYNHGTPYVGITQCGGKSILFDYVHGTD